eukprot:Awhi_evm1s1751
MFAVRQASRSTLTVLARSIQTKPTNLSPHTMTTPAVRRLPSAQEKRIKEIQRRERLAGHATKGRHHF